MGMHADYTETRSKSTFGPVLSKSKRAFADWIAAYGEDMSGERHGTNVRVEMSDDGLSGRIKVKHTPDDLNWVISRLNNSIADAHGNPELGWDGGV